MINDLGIVLEIFGFVLLLLVAGRVPLPDTVNISLWDSNKFDYIREKAIPNKYISRVLVVGIVFVIIGLIMQFTFLQYTR